MNFLKKHQAATTPPSHSSTKSLGDAAEERALQHLLAAGLTLVQRNYRTPGRGGGEVDLIMRTPEGTLVFVEVRSRSAPGFGGAAASISPAKRQRIIFAAQHFLQRLRQPPPCRFDVVTLQQGQLQWLAAAFDAS